MKYFLFIFFLLSYATTLRGQDQDNLNYDALVNQILEDIPLENFKNAPTFLRVYYANHGCVVYENGKNYNYQTKVTPIRTLFLSEKKLALLQRKIKTALIPYLEAQTMNGGIFFHGDRVFKAHRILVPKFETITHGEYTYYNTKKVFDYFPYKNKPVNFSINKGSLFDYIKQTNHIKLEFHQPSPTKVKVAGTINHKKITLNYQQVYGKWQQVPQFRESDITHYNHNGELFIKHNDITFEYEKIFGLDEVDITSETDITPVHKESFQPQNLISIDSIADFSFSELRNLKFTHEKEGYKYEFFQFNSELFAFVCYYKDDEKWSFSNVTFYPYSPVSITKNKRIYYLFGEDNGIIIPEKSGVRIFLKKAQDKYNIKDFSTKQQQKHYRNYDTEILAHLTNNLTFDHYYKIKEVAREKRLYNYLGIDKFHKSYDSIFANRFIVGVKNGKYDIYNQAFQKLPYQNVRAFHLIQTTITEASNYIPYSAQILHKNELQTIYLSPHKEKKKKLFQEISFMEMQYSSSNLKIVKENDYFYLKNLETPLLKGTKIPIDAKEIDSIYFIANKKKQVNFREIQQRYGLNLHQIIHVKTKQGTQYLYHTSYLNSSTFPFIKTALEEIEVYADCIRFKENNLYGYYGIHSKGRFKKLDAFQGFFTRFELPNGQKGWLDRNGKEYIDL